MGTDQPGLLAERLIEMAPSGMSKVFFGCTGSDANDTQVKLVWFYNNVLGRPEKKKIIARQRGYHGVSVMSAGLTGFRGMHENFDLPLAPVRHTTAAHRLWEAEPGMSDEEFAQKLADDLDALIVAEGPETVAAFIAEPIAGAGGVLVPPETYFQKIQSVLDRYDVLLIADEVITAFGRLGQWFGSDVFGIEPDLITVAKGLTSGYMPLSGCIVSERIWRVLVDGSDEWAVRSRLHVLRASARGRRGDDEPRPHRARRARRAGRGPRGAACIACSATRSPTIRSSARYAAWR